MTSFSKILTLSISLLIPVMGLPASEPVMVNAAFKNYVEPWMVRANFQAPKEGDLNLIVDINADGTIADWIVSRADHQDMVKAIERVIDEWTFHPATKDGEPIPIVVGFVFTFSKRGTSLVEGNIADLYLKSIHKIKEDIVFVRDFKELDRLPEPVTIVRPVISRDIPKDQRVGEAVVSFFIDQEGKVRIPVIESYEGHRGLADAAYNAILEWEFKPPTVHRRPVMVHVRQPFQFLPSTDPDTP